jgi:hypothetical protein
MTGAERAAVVRDSDDDGWVCCRRCGRVIGNTRDHNGLTAGSKHHRKKRRNADADRVENIVILCGTGTTFCHGWCHAEPKQAHDDGWVCWSWENPAERPCLTLLDTMVMFLPDGSAVVDQVWPRTNPGPPI